MFQKALASDFPLINSAGFECLVYLLGSKTQWALRPRRLDRREDARLGLLERADTSHMYKFASPLREACYFYRYLSFYCGDMIHSNITQLCFKSPDTRGIEADLRAISSPIGVTAQCYVIVFSEKQGNALRLAIFMPFFFGPWLGLIP